VSMGNHVSQSAITLIVGSQASFVSLESTTKMSVVSFIKVVIKFYGAKMKVKLFLCKA